MLKMFKVGIFGNFQMLKTVSLFFGGRFCCSCLDPVRRGSRCQDLLFGRNNSALFHDITNNIMYLRIMVTSSNLKNYDKKIMIMQGWILCKKIEFWAPQPKKTKKTQRQKKCPNVRQKLGTWNVL